MKQQNRMEALSALAEMVAVSFLYLVAICDLVMVALASIVVRSATGGGFLDAISIGIPFWVSWFGMAGWLGAYRSRAFATVRTCAVRTAELWIVATIVGILVQVSIEHETFPFGIVAPMAGLALVLLTASRCTFALVVPWRRIVAQEEGTPEPGPTIGGEIS
jgi:hypothetical protein